MGFQMYWNKIWLVCDS